MRLLEQRGGRPERLGAEGVLRARVACIGRASADLALASTRFPGDPVLERLERAGAASARGRLWRAHASGARCGAFCSHGYWRDCARTALLLAVSLIAIFAPGPAGRGLGGPRPGRGDRVDARRLSRRGRSARASPPDRRGDAGGRSRARSSPTTSRSRSWRSRAAWPSARARCCCSPTTACCWARSRG